MPDRAPGSGHRTFVSSAVAMHSQVACKRLIERLILCSLVSAQIVPMWEEVTAQFMKDKQVEKEFGWVREMFAWSLAALKVGLHFLYSGMEDGILDRQSGASSLLYFLALKNCCSTQHWPLTGLWFLDHFALPGDDLAHVRRKAAIISQLPSDKRIDNAPIIHYTYGCLLSNTTTNKVVW